MRSTLSGILCAAALASALSCGQKFELPPQPDAGRIPTPGTYNLDKVWQIHHPTDLALQGSYLYVIEEVMVPGLPDSSARRVGAYLSRQKNPRRPSFVTDYEDLIRPVLICVAKKEATYIFVADAGDSTIKRYHFTGGPPVLTFRDPLWTTSVHCPDNLDSLCWPPPTEFTGLAADNDLNVYLSDAVKDSIYKYDSQGNRVRAISSYGSGQGYVIDPHGLAFAGGALWVADTGKNWVQRLRPDATNLAFSEHDPIGFNEAHQVLEPRDVATTPSGQSGFVAQTGNDRIMRFQATGAPEDTVYSPEKRETMVDPPIRGPRYVAADDSLVFVSDSANSRVVVLRLSKS
ncbi:MAG: hypothetical protein FJY88_05690 [Candidatus Eisenbacteria bacterium]|nr:hypothetical protein [Candidatus Eisenbacteria bacterium]